MKIVVNRCAGGFCVSRACFLELFRRGAKIIETTSFKKATTSLGVPDGESWPSDEWVPAKEAGWYDHDGFSFEDSGAYAPSGCAPIYCSTFRDDEHRTDVDLVELIEIHGSEWANGDHAELEIVNVPDNVEWAIVEYDGIEHVAEKHRTW